MLCRIRRRPAFTMIEVMVGLVVASVLLGVLYQLFNTSRTVNLKVEGKTEAIQSANLALEAIKRDLKQLVTRPFIRVGDTYQGIVGDPQHPVLISDDGTEMSFHIPDRSTSVPDPASKKFKLATVYYGLWQKAVKDGGYEGTVYHLVRCEGSNPNLAQEAGSLALGGRANLGAVFLREGKDSASKTMAPIRFRLLGPNANLGPGSPSAPSGDNNYYVELTVFGADSAGREDQGRMDLVALDEPSRLANVPELRIDEFTLFEPNPAAPLFIARLPPPSTLVGTPVNLPPGAAPQGTPLEPTSATPPTPTTPSSSTPANPPAVSPVTPATTPTSPGTTPTSPGTTPTSPGTTPVATPAPTTAAPTPTPAAGVPDPTGVKSWAAYTQLDANGKPTGVYVEAVLRNDGSMRFTIKDNKTNQVIDEKIMPNTPQADGQNASRAAVDSWLVSKGIDPNKVPNDPSMTAPADYSAN